MKREEKLISVNSLILDLKNPRHEEVASQSEAIKLLCDSEDVVRLARDIVNNGLNPLDRFAVMEAGRGRTKKYTVKEGNRRLCALKLIRDPELAPSELRSKFDKFSDAWSPIAKLPCVVFTDEQDLDLWLQRRHHGSAEGVGQKAWNAEQKARHSGSDGRNKIAQAFLDYAVQTGFLSEEQRKGKITTVQRFLGNKMLRNALGLIYSKEDRVIRRDRDKSSFDSLAKRFVEDFIDGTKVNSRKRSDDIAEYAQDLRSHSPDGENRVEPVELGVDDKPKSRKDKKRRPKRPTKLPYDDDLHEQLEKLGNYKLRTLYYSICDIHLVTHVLLVTVGLWSFIESLTAVVGKDDNKDFVAFLSKQKLNSLGFKQKYRAVKDALDRLQSGGNSTKHHQSAGSFNPEQLASDYEVIAPVLTALIEQHLA